MNPSSALIRSAFALLEPVSGSPLARLGFEALRDAGEPLLTPMPQKTQTVGRWIRSARKARSGSRAERKLERIREETAWAFDRDRCYCGYCPHFRLIDRLRWWKAAGKAIPPGE